MIIDKNHELILEIYKSFDSKNISAEELLAHLKKRKELQNIEDKKIAIKIDVERHELSVLEGMRDLITKNKIILQIELFDKRKENIEKYLELRRFKKIKVIQKDHYFMNF